MKLLKPSWVNHDDLPIFSIDVHPDSSRFATGGQGKDSGRIVIWNMGPVVDKEKENDENAPKILCRMDHHYSCVNVVRWSNNGLFLASGSDDKLIMIWQYAQGECYENIENWKCGHTLRGHSGDVMDLSWSSKDQYLASCSVDNTVIIWNALKFPDIICRINAHAGLVKGVAWDPVGNYLATQSDDKTLKIWKTLDWGLEKCIDEPFKQCTGTTHVLRLNWSPDGQLIISAHAINNGAPTAQVIDRGNKWNTKLDFVGHRKAVTAVRFFPQILKPNDAQHKDFKTHCLCALGSRDRSISIWLTNYSRALCAFHDLFDNPIMDLSWSRHPNPGLLACSMDGTVAYLEFNYKEIGKPLTKEETNEFFMKKYNYDINASIPLKDQQLNTQKLQYNQANKKDVDNKIKLIENLDVLLAQEQKLKQEQEKKQTNLTSSNDNSMNNLNSSSSNTPKSSADKNKQIERRLPDGRRRITPICISKPGEYDTPKPFTSLPMANFNKVAIGFEANSITSKTATEQSTIIVEKRDERNEIIEISPVKSIIYNKQNVVSFQNSNSNDKFFNNYSNDASVKVNEVNIVASKTTNDNVEKMDTSTTAKQTTTNVNSNVITIPSVTSVPSQQPKTSTSQPDNQNQPQQHSNVRKQLIKDNNNIINTTNKDISNLNKDKVSKSSTAPSISTSKNQLNSPSVSTAANKQRNITTNQTLSQPTQSTTTQAPKLVSPVKNNLVENQSNHHHHHHHTTRHYLNPLKIDENLTTRSNRTPITVEIHNSINIIDKPTSHSYQHVNESDYQINLIKYVKDRSIKWQVYFYARICEVTYNNNLTAVVCEDATLSLIKSKSGTQLCCPIQLESKAAALKCNSNYCMCITINGFVYVWKYNDSLDQSNETTSSPISTIINRQSCENILRDSKLYGEYSNSSLTDSGIPIISMSKNRSYYFSIQTQCWHLIPVIGANLSSEESAAHLFINSSSIFTRTTNNNNISLDELNGPLSMIQSRSKSSNIVKTIDLINKTSVSSIRKEDFTLTHLESQMNASLGLNSSKEYKFWLLTYARYMVENGYEDKLTELCNFLLGPLHSINWSSMILNHKKHDLLQEILAIMVQNLEFQRLYNYYKQQLSFINNVNSKKVTSVLDRLNNPNSRVHNFNIKNAIQAKLDARTSSATPPPQILVSATETPVASNQINEIEMAVDGENLSETTVKAADENRPADENLNQIESNSTQESNQTNENERAKEAEEKNDHFKIPQDPSLFTADEGNKEIFKEEFSPPAESTTSPTEKINNEENIELENKKEAFNKLDSNIADSGNIDEIIDISNDDEINLEVKNEPATISEILMM